MSRVVFFSAWLVALSACSKSSDTSDPDVCGAGACAGATAGAGSGGAGGQGSGGVAGSGGAEAGGTGAAGGLGGEAGSGASAGDAGSGGSLAGQGGEAGSAGTAGDAGGSAGQGGNAGSGGAGGACQTGATLLSQTGLYQDDGVTLADGVASYTPKFGLWSDSAEKRRWILLPKDTQIDTSNMDFWDFPSGTKLWKEFSRDGVRVETRLIQKNCDGKWFFMPYLWDVDQQEARAVPDGVVNARGTAHDVPNHAACIACHEGTLHRVLGFSALQLSHTLPGLTLAELRAKDLLTNPPSADFALPGTANEQAALGYLHANCGHCHNPYGPVASRTNMELFLETAKLDSVETTTVYLSTVEREVQQGTPLGTCVIKPKSLDESVLYARMQLRAPQPSPQMPPVGSEDPDTAALAVIADWINALPLQPEGACSKAAPMLTRHDHGIAHGRASESLSQRVRYHAQK